MTVGNIHSLESFGTVDGPGLRFVVFMQGCPLRCLYCHNPDTWSPTATGAYQMTAEELYAEVAKYRSFIQRGGVTVTGGEPLMQAGFVSEFFDICRQNGIHTALDTSGAVFTPQAQQALRKADLVLLDIKGATEQMHQSITGASMEANAETLRFLQQENIATWIRHVVVPGFTDNDDHLNRIADEISGYSCVKRVEILPYHTMGASKYEQLGLKYRLGDTPPLSAERAEEVREIFRRRGLTVQ